MNKNKTTQGLNRREFIRSTAAVGAGLIFSPMVLGETTPGAGAKSDDINVAIIGVGDQGRVLLESALKIPGLKFKALCDIWTDFNQKNVSNLLKNASKSPWLVPTRFPRVAPAT